MKIKTIIYKIFAIGSEKISDRLANIWLKIRLWMLDAEFSNIKTTGVPFVKISRGGRLVIGRNFSMNNGAHGNPIGCFKPCTLVVDRGVTMRIGHNVGISQTALIAADDITIGDNVKMGGGVCVYTTDFHSLDPRIRASSDDQVKRAIAPVNIGDNVFIGAFSIILKGVTIGENSIIGAGSVVTRSIPPNEIWGGNPARLIRKI